MNDYYEKNHQQYFDATVTVDSSTFLDPLARLLEPGAAILDIGCGSGRDLLWFAKKGFRPTGFEQSKSLAILAQDHSGCPVIQADFHSYDFSKLRFSALVLVGSLVHVSREKFPGLLESICQALIPGGLILISMKEGKGVSPAKEKDQDGRFFTLWSKEDLEQVFQQLGLTILSFSRQVSKICQDDSWLGFVLRLEC